MQDGFGEDFAGHGGGVQPVATEAGDVPDIGLHLAQLRHPVAGVGHEAGPSEFGFKRGKLWVDLQHGGAQVFCDGVRRCGPGGDPATPQEAGAVVNQAVIVGGAAVVEDCGFGPDGLGEQVGGGFGQHHVGGDRQHRALEAGDQLGGVASGRENGAFGGDDACRGADPLLGGQAGGQGGAAFVDFAAETLDFAGQRAQVIERMDVEGGVIGEAVAVAGGGEAVLDGGAVEVGEVVVIVAGKGFGVGMEVGCVIEAAQVQEAGGELGVLDVQGLDMVAQALDTFDAQAVQGAGVVGANPGCDGVRPAGEGGRDDAAVAARGAEANRFGFEDGDRDALARQFQGGGQAGETAADDHGVGVMRAFQLGTLAAVAAGLGVKGRRVHQASSSIQTGTWSEGLMPRVASSWPRTALSMPASTSRSAACGLSRRWSMRMPLLRSHAPRWKSQKV